MKHYSALLTITMVLFLFVRDVSAEYSSSQPCVDQRPYDPSSFVLKFLSTGNNFNQY